MAASAARRVGDDPFEIHEDARTEETEMMGEDEADSDNESWRATPTDDRVGVPDDRADEEDQDEEEESSEDEQIESSVQSDMDKLSNDFPGFRGKYRLIKRIGEGESACVWFISE